MRPRIEFCAPTRPRLVELAREIREDDLLEMTRAGWSGPLNCLEAQVAMSCYSECLLVNGAVVAAGGLSKRDLIGDEGFPWMFTSVKAEKHKRALMYGAKLVVGEMLRYASQLRAVTDSKYHRACRMMGWLGFVADEQIEINGHPFTVFRYDEV